MVRAGLGVGLEVGGGVLVSVVFIVGMQAVMIEDGVVYCGERWVGGGDVRIALVSEWV